MHLRIIIFSLSASILFQNFILKDSSATASQKSMIFFDRVDLDQNGRISLSELKAFQDIRVSAIDINGDGFVTKTEFVSGRTFPADRINHDAWLQKRKAIFKKLDLDRDGRVCPDERKASSAKAFFLYDRNGDGGLSLSELQTFHEPNR